MSTVVRGPSYPLLVRQLASLVTLAVAVAAGVAIAPLSGLQGQAAALTLAAGAVVLLGWVVVVTGVTEVTGTAVRQRGLVWREARFAEIRQLRLVHLPGLEAVFVPRLLVRTDGLGFRGFCAGTPDLTAAFRALAGGRWPAETATVAR